MTSLPFFIYFFTLFIVGKKCYSIPPLKKRYLDTTSIKDRSFFPQLNTKKREKIKCGTRIFRDNLNVSQKATQEKTFILSCVRELALTRTIPCSKKKVVFLYP